MASWLIPEMSSDQAKRVPWTVDDVIEVIGGILLALVLTALVLAVI